MGTPVATVAAAAPPAPSAVIPPVTSSSRACAVTGTRGTVVVLLDPGTATFLSETSFWGRQECVGARLLDTTEGAHPSHPAGGGGEATPRSLPQYTTPKIFNQ